jgi:hypothetical protein
MAYLGHGPLGPNHPFSGVTISFGKKPTKSPNQPEAGHKNTPSNEFASTSHRDGIIAPSDGSVLSPSLVQTYRNTDYRVGYPPSFVLYIGQYSPELVAEHSRHNVKSSLFITASNPYGKLLDPTVNFSRYTLLLGDLRIQNLIAEEASGQHPSGNWPAERSLIVYGVDLKLARELGASHNQNAVVWTDSDGIPKLILLR